MAHVRQQIREALATLLIGLPTSATRVYKTRTTVLQNNELPAIIVATGSESVQALDMHGISLERTLQIEITLKAEVVGNVDNVLDAMLAELEARINASDANKTLNGLCGIITLNSIDIQTDEELQLPLGEAICRFETTYFTDSNNAEISV